MLRGAAQFFRTGEVAGNLVCAKSQNRNWCLGTDGDGDFYFYCQTSLAGLR
jgi:hypothetical protein